MSQGYTPEDLGTKASGWQSVEQWTSACVPLATSTAQNILCHQVIPYIQLPIEPHHRCHCPGSGLYTVCRARSRHSHFTCAWTAEPRVIQLFHVGLSPFFFFFCQDNHSESFKIQLLGCRLQEHQSFQAKVDLPSCLCEPPS